MIDENKARFVGKVFQVVDQIPRGTVAAYSQVARLAGALRRARLVGRILGTSEEAYLYPCHRVVTVDGRLVPGWADQARKLKAEGVVFKDATHVDMSQSQWQA